MLRDSFSKQNQLPETGLFIASFFGQNGILSPLQLMHDAGSIQ